MHSFTWEAMLDGFRSFGGVAENVEQRRGPHGLGLFAIDPSQPVHVRTPEQLLVRIDNIRADGDTIRLIDPTPHPAGFGDWFARFQRHFSWGADGRRSIDTFERGLAELPAAVLTTLKVAGLLNLERRHHGAWEDVVLAKFLQSRCFHYHGNKILMPVIELVNHGTEANAFITGNGIAVSGSFASEVLVHYSRSDPIRRFFSYGFCCPERQVYSLPLNFQLNPQTRVRVGCNFAKPTEDSPVIFAGHNLPGIRLDEGVWVIDYLLLATERTPRIPRTLICKALLEEPGLDAEEIFEVAHSLNHRALYAILRASEPYHTPVVEGVRNALLTHLEALSHHYGLRRDLLP